MKASHRKLAAAVLNAAEPQAKAAAAAAAMSALNDIVIGEEDDFAPPDRPARPARPELAAPGEVPRRRLTSPKGRAALLHAIAHIELNAIDLAFDMAARFAGAVAAEGLDATAFVTDWFEVGADEARHFAMLERRMATLGVSYGDFPAHDGLWTAAEATRDDVLARLAIAPMVLEARGLDVTPAMIERLEAADDEESAAILKTIYVEEVDHVRKGARWFNSVCAARGLSVTDTFQRLVAERFAGKLKRPFNHNARLEAGLAQSLYEPLA
ncbi:MAG: ferritin-like domain-containing protein [Pseudomonadota bacterium]